VYHRTVTGVPKEKGQSRRTTQISRFTPAAKAVVGSKAIKMSWLLDATQPTTSSTGNNLITVLVVTTLPVTLPLIFNWFKDRNASSRRLRQLDEATKIVAFWDSWLKTIALVGSEESGFTYQDVARRELALAADSVTTILRTTRESSEGRATLMANPEYIRWRESLPWWRRLLLLYKPGTTATTPWFYRIVYYAYLISFPFEIIVLNLLPPRLHGIHAIRLNLLVICTVLLITSFARKLAMRAEVPKLSV
jgi:hypothetical protein